ncbi:MAG: LytR C-terminal domain-containing protein [Candidatus Zixiibacteriota bacterium]
MESTSRPRRNRSTPSTPRWKVRLLDVGIVLATALICVFVFSFSTRLSYSRPEVREAPIIVRAQILNGCGRANLARQVAEHVGRLQVDRMRFDVVDMGNFDRTDVRRSFVINRRLSPEQLRAVLSALGVGPVEIADGSQRSNDLGVDFTLVLGSNAVDPTTTVTDAPQSAGRRP